MYIGVQGFINSGKDTASKYIESRDDFIKDSFAKSLKDACSHIFNWPRELLEGNTAHSREWREKVDPWWAEKLGISDFSPRKALQLVGTELFRDNFHEDMWLLTFQHRLEHQHQGKNVILSDCRFKNEIAFFKKVGGKIIFIDDGKQPEWYEIALEANSGNQDAEAEMLNVFSHIHRSEWDWVGTKADIVIKNDFKERSENTLNEFYRRIDEAIAKLPNFENRNMIFS